jgi:tetratricopeptide (TPR) repeat protein
MRSITRILAAAALAFGLGAALNLELVERKLAKPYDVTYVPSGRVMRWAALGQRGLVSDLYWLATVQYIGEPRGEQRGYEKLLPLVDLVTDLDPRHGYAYQTAGIVLSAGGRIDESNAILKKGLERGPTYWTFPYYLSFNHWFYLGDYETGAQYARIAAATPGASPNVSHLALSLSSKSGNAEDAIQLLEGLRATVQDEVSAARLDEQLKLAVLERDAQALERAVEAFRALNGRDPFTLDDLIVAGLVTRLPDDPFGGRYEWNPADRKVRSSANRFRFQLREKPAAAGFQHQPSETDIRRSQ